MINKDFLTSRVANKEWSGLSDDMLQIIGKKISNRILEKKTEIINQLNGLKTEAVNEEYGDKRDYKKIDIYVNGKYDGSTNWAKTCKEAIEKYKKTNPDAKNVTAKFSKK